MSGRRQVSVDAADAACAAAALNIIQAWLAGAPEHVIASLAAACGQPTARALSLARELACDLRYYSAVLSSAVRADDNPDDPERNAF